MSDPTDPTDYALQLHTAFYERVSNDAGLKGQFKTFSRTPMVSVQPATLPRLSVYFLRDSAVPDGDANAGEPKFFHTVHIGVSGAIVAESEDTKLVSMDRAMASINQLILTDPTFIRMVEGIGGYDRRYVFSRVGETSLSEIQIEYLFTYRTDWPPEVTDNFDGINVVSKHIL